MNKPLQTHVHRLMAAEAIAIGLRYCMLDPASPVHGLPHWTSVWHRGISLAQKTGADLHVLTWFAFTHDCQRANDLRDPHHGSRAADRLYEIRRSGETSLAQMPPDKFDELLFAVRLHSEGLREAPITVQTCWDADRLDLPRVGIIPDPDLLCTWDAKQMARVVLDPVGPIDYRMI